MDKKLKELYKELLSLKFKDGRTVFERINADDLCLAGHHIGRLYKNGLLIYGQAMNGWGNDISRGIDALVEDVLNNAEDYKELYTIVDYDGWHDDNGVSYFYKRSKFWKLNYQVITEAKDEAFYNFYIKRTNENEKKKLLDNAWTQGITWSNLYKISFSMGGNPDDEIIDVIREVSLKIILREIELLKPTRILFNTGEILFADLALNKGNVFGVQKVNANSNIFYTGEYEYLPNEKCKIVVCKRPDIPMLHYKNADILNEAREILQAFDSI